MKKLAIAVLVVLLLSGCAQVQYALEMTPQRVEDAFNDPVRRTHIAAQIGRLSTVAGVGIGCFILIPPPANLVLCPMVAVVWDFLTYEFVLETLSKERVSQGEPSLLGPYWETGPHTDLGEVFVKP